MDDNNRTFLQSAYTIMAICAVSAGLLAVNDISNSSATKSDSVKQTKLSDNKSELNKYKNKYGYLTIRIVDKYGESGKTYLVTDNKTGVEYYYAKSDKKPDLTLRVDQNKQPVINSAWSKRYNKIAPDKLSEIKSELKQIHYQGNLLVYQNGNQNILSCSNDRIKDVNSSSDMYLVNSVQKNQTALLIYQTVESGKLKLSDKVSDYYESIDKSVTISDLLNMTSGLSESDSEMKEYVVSGSDNQTVNNIVKHVHWNKNSYGKSVYSSVNYVILSGILEKIYHKSYNSVYKSEIIDKLNLKHTDFNSDNLNIQEGTLSGTKSVPEINTLSADIGAGNVFSNCSDMLKILQFEQRKFNTDLGKKIWNQNQNNKYAGGFYNLDDRKISNGAGNGYRSCVIISNDGKVAVVALTNTPEEKYEKFKDTVKNIYNILSDTEAESNTNL